MRILFWADTLWPVVGGVEVLAATFLPALKSRGHEIEIVTRLELTGVPLPERDDYIGLPLHRLPFFQALESRDIRRMGQVRQKLARIKQSFKPDLVHLFHPGSGALFHLMTPVEPAPKLVVSLHQAYVEDTLAPDTMRGQLMRRADWLVMCSHAILAATRDRLAEAAEHASVISNSLPRPDLSPEPLPWDEPRLLCVGRVVPQKGFDVALRAFARLASRHPKARLVIAGDGESKPMLEKLAVELGVAGAVNLLGWVDPPEIPALMNRSTLIVMPSRDEPFGLVALQAGQMARPIVASRVAGLPEIVVDGETGLLVEPEDVDGLAAAIAYVLDHPEAAVAMGQAGRRRAHEAFSWERHIDEYEALFHRLVEGKGSAGAR